MEENSNKSSAECNAEIRKAIRTIVGNDTKTPFYVCQVSSVNKTAKTCDAVTIVGDAKTGINGIRLVVNGNDSFVLYPAINSEILVMATTNKEYYIVNVDILESISLIIGQQELEIDKTGFVFNQGNNGIPLSDKLVSKLNALESRVNNLINLFNAHTHVSVTSLGTPTPPVTLDTDAVITPTVQTDIESSYIKQP
jgi:hypothetical protein